MNEQILIDGRGAVLGRLASFVAKALLKGSSVVVINTEQIIVSGKKSVFVEKVLQKRRMGSGGSMKGPIYIRKSDLLVKRIIRGMLPWDRPRGREAFKRLRCYEGEFTFSESQLKEAQCLARDPPVSYSTIKEIVVSLK